MTLALAQPVRSAYTPVTSGNFDHLGLLTSPFQINSGGYQIRMQGGAVHNVFGD